MKKLKMIERLIILAELLVLIGVIMVIIVMVVKPEGSYIDIQKPHWVITSGNLQDKVSDLLPESDKPILLTADVLKMQVPVDLKTRFIMIILILIIGIYMAYLLRLIQKIICDVRKKTPFNIKNTIRLKRIGMLVTIAPLFEWILLSILSLWLSQKYHFDGLQLESNSSLGWPVFILGLLIVTLGIAFEQGQKIQEENQLTI